MGQLAPLQTGDGPTEEDLSGIFYRDFFESGGGVCVHVAIQLTHPYSFKTAAWFQSSLLTHSLNGALFQSS
jgi:hypothetical protein